MATFNKFYSFPRVVAEGNLESDTLKIFLTNDTPAVTDVQKSDLSDVANGNGYTTGGATITVSSSTQTAGLYELSIASDITWTASGGTIGPFRYVVQYDDTLAGDPLLGWWDYGSEITLVDTQPFTAEVSGTILNGY